VKGDRLHVRRKLKENRGKTKKLEAPILKRILRISLGLLVSLVLELVSERRN